jgi:hypothetical protein
MKYTISIALIFCFTALLSAQNAPYNPDVDENQFINTNDLASFLTVYGGPFISDDDDVDVTNELQELILSGDTLFISDANYVILPFNQDGGNEVSPFPPGAVETYYAGNMGYIRCWKTCDTSTEGGYENWKMVTDIEMFSEPQQFLEIANDGNTWFFVPENSPFRFSGNNASNIYYWPYFYSGGSDIQTNSTAISSSNTRCVCSRWVE